MELKDQGQSLEEEFEKRVEAPPVCSSHKCARDNLPLREAFRVWKGIQARHAVWLQRAEAYKQSSCEQRILEKQKSATERRRFRQELCSLKKAARRKLPRYQSIVTEENKQKWRTEHAERLAAAKNVRSFAELEALMAQEDSKPKTLRKPEVQRPPSPEPMPLYDAETGELLPPLHPASMLFSEDRLRALQPSPRSPTCTPPRSPNRGATLRPRLDKTRSLGTTRRKLGALSTTRTIRTDPCMLKDEPGPVKQQAARIRWAEPRNSSDDDSQADEDDEDPEFVEHRWNVVLDNLAFKNPTLHAQIQDIKHCRAVHKQELIDLIEDERHREKQRKAEMDAAVGDSFRARLIIRHELARKERRRGIERVRWDYEYLMGTKMAAANILR